MPGSGEPGGVPAPAVPGARTKVFVSYSHRDRAFLDRLLVHMKPLRKSGVDVWSDRRLTPGVLWREEIGRALDETRVAVLLVSIDFLTSDFVNEHELPALLEAAGAAGVWIIPVVVQPCANRIKAMPWLERYFSPNPSYRALSQMNGPTREAFYDQLAADIQKFLKAPG